MEGLPHPTRQGQDYTWEARMWGGRMSATEHSKHSLFCTVIGVQPYTQPLHHQMTKCVCRGRAKG